MADSCALEPAPSSLPERSLLLSLLADDSFPAPHAETARPRAMAATPGAAMRRREVGFTLTPEFTVEFTVVVRVEPRNLK